MLGLRLSPTTTGFLVALLTGLFLCGGAAILLNANAFAPLGAAADQSYRTAYLTKFAHHWGLVDYAYKDLPVLLSPAVLLGARAVERAPRRRAVADAQGRPARRRRSSCPTAGWLLWRPIVGPRRAAAVVIVSSLAFLDWYNPHLWLAIAVFVPWWLWYVLGAGRSRRLSRGEARRGGPDRRRGGTHLLVRAPHRARAARGTARAAPRRRAHGPRARAAPAPRGRHGPRRGRWS